MFFDMLTCGQPGQRKDSVDMSLFVWGCLRMKGVATSVDLHSLDFELRLMHRSQKQLFKYCVDLLEKLARTHGHGHSHMRPAAAAHAATPAAVLDVDLQARRPLDISEDNPEVSSAWSKQLHQVADRHHTDSSRNLLLRQLEADSEGGNNKFCPDEEAI